MPKSHVHTAPEWGVDVDVEVALPTRRVRPADELQVTRHKVHITLQPPTSWLSPGSQWQNIHALAKGRVGLGLGWHMHIHARVTPTSTQRMHVHVRLHHVLMQR